MFILDYRYSYFSCLDLIYGLCVFVGVCFLLYHFSKQAAVSVKALEKQLQQKKDSDPIMAGILEEVRHIVLSTLEYHVPLLIGELVKKVRDSWLTPYGENY